jgi:hypothetical protein
MAIETRRLAIYFLAKKANRNNAFSLVLATQKRICPRRNEKRQYSPSHLTQEKETDRRFAQFSGAKRSIKTRQQSQ